MSETNESRDRTNSQKGPSESANAGRGAAGGTPQRKDGVSPGVGRGVVRQGIADADKLARTGSVNEAVRDTPPAGTWNDVARNE